MPEPTEVAALKKADSLSDSQSELALKILVADDADDIIQLLEFHLLRAGFIVLTATNGKEALEIAQAETPAIAILDWMMPEISGVEVCKQLRDYNPSIYIIMLTALNSEDQRVIGLEAGADDYLTKPFSGREVVARIRNMVRRQSLGLEPSATMDSTALAGSPNLRPEASLRIDVERWQVWKEGQEIELTRLEFELLKFLAANPNIVFSRDQLLNQVWNYGYVGDDRVVDVHMARLRKKLETDPAHPRYIQTIRGVGYKYSP